jgi:transposase
MIGLSKTINLRGGAVRPPAVQPRLAGGNKTDKLDCRGLQLLEAKLPLLPPHSRCATEELLAQLEQVVAGIGRFEQRMREVFAPSAKLQLIETLPGIGFILAVVILVEVGNVDRFARSE